MPLKAPDRALLQKLAAFNNFKLEGAELEEFTGLIETIMANMTLLDEMPAPPPPLAYPKRDHGTPASRQEDPLNAILRHCSVKGTLSGPLAGKRIALKDSVLLAGVPLTLGSKVFEDYVPDRDATIVTRMLDAGAEIVAKTNMDDFALAATGDTSAFGPVLNPHSRDHLAGGSSGGSAASLYYDGIDLSIGGDQGGSIRVPASWCGVVGLKPTHSLVPYTGVIGVDASFDHVGPMGRRVADVALLLEVIAGKDPLDPRQGEIPKVSYTQDLTAGVKGLRIGILSEGFAWERGEPEVYGAVRNAIATLTKMGATAVEVSAPTHRQLQGLLRGLATEGLLATALSGGLGYHHQGGYNPQLASALGEGLRLRAQELPPFVKVSLLVATYLARQYPGRIYPKAQVLRQELRAGYDLLLEQVDVLAMPTTPIRALPVDASLKPLQRPMRGWTANPNTAPFNISGHPALSFPCAMVGGLPVGLMLVGRHFDDAKLLQAANAYEKGVDWQRAS